MKKCATSKHAQRRIPSTEEESEGVGFRIVRPLKQLPRTQMEQFWNADAEELIREARARIFEFGKGKLGTIDKKLLDDIEEPRRPKQQ